MENEPQHRSGSELSNDARPAEDFTTFSAHSGVELPEVRRTRLSEELRCTRNRVADLVDNEQYEQAIELAGTAPSQFEEFNDLYLSSLYLIVELESQLEGRHQQVEAAFAAGCDCIKSEVIADNAYALQFIRESFLRLLRHDRFIENVGRVESYLDEISDKDINHSDDARRLRMAVGNQYVSIGELDKAENHFLQVLTKHNSDPIAEVTKLRLGQLYARTGNNKTALLVLKKAEDYFLLNKDTKIDPAESLHLGLTAAVCHVSLLKENASPAELKKLIERLDELNRYCADRVPPSGQEWSLIKLQHLDIQRYMGAREAVITGTAEVIAFEQTHGRSQNDIAQTAARIQGLVFHGAATATYNSWQNMIANAGYSMAEDIPDTVRVSRNKVDTVISDMDLTHTFAPHLPRTAKDAMIPLRAVLNAFAAVSDTMLSRAEAIYTHRLTNAVKVTDKIHALRSLEVLYASTGNEEKSSSIERQIEKLTGE